MTSAYLEQINLYPVKSLGGLSLSNAWVEKQGLAFDRRFMLQDKAGHMVTARKYPAMVLVCTVLLSDGLVFTAKGRLPLVIRYRDFDLNEVSATVWSDTFTAYTTTAAANAWFSELLGIPVTLLFCGEQSNRVRAKVGHNVSFADGYPVLIISQASLDELNRRSSELHQMDQFRTNLVVSGSEPFIEDSWRRIKIGDVVFESVKPCERCILTTVDVQNGQFRETKEPLKTLSSFRANDQGGVFFGQNLVAKNEGMIRAGDEVEVLEYKEKEYYADNQPTRLSLRCVARESIARDFTTFWFSVEHGPIPDYRPGQYLPIEIEINGVKHSRCYTLSSAPCEQGRLAISVKRVAQGTVSNWLSDHLRVGDSLYALQPDGQFHLDPERSQPLLLLSAGSGITPMLSILRYLAVAGNITDTVFYHQCRSEADIPCRKELERLALTHPGLTLKFALTEPTESWRGLCGRLSLDRIEEIEDVERRQAYVCGPDGFMKTAKNLLIRSGLAATAYHQESFGMATLEKGPMKTLTISIDGRQFVGDNQSTLLQQADTAGISIASSCRAGLCGACRVKVVSGEVKQADAPALPFIGEGMALACCCIPQDDVIIDSK
jgi:uncharacterized protein YcbX/ferredoxin-NADP reductase